MITMEVLNKRVLWKGHIKQGNTLEALGLDYEVELTESYSFFNGKKMLNPKQVIRRKDNGIPFEHVGSYYTPLQNKTIYQAMTNEVGAPNYGGYLGNGEWVFMMKELDTFTIGNLSFVNLLVVMTSHNTDWKLRAILLTYNYEYKSFVRVFGDTKNRYEYEFKHYANLLVDFQNIYEKVNYEAYKEHAFTFLSAMDMKLIPNLARTLGHRSFKTGKKLTTQVKNLTGRMVDAWKLNTFASASKLHFFLMIHSYFNSELRYRSEVQRIETFFQNTIHSKKLRQAQKAFGG